MSVAGCHEKEPSKSEHQGRGERAGAPGRVIKDSCRSWWRHGGVSTSRLGVKAWRWAGGEGADHPGKEIGMI